MRILLGTGPKTESNPSIITFYAKLTNIKSTTSNTTDKSLTMMDHPPTSHVKQSILKSSHSQILSFLQCELLL